MEIPEGDYRARAVRDGDGAILAEFGESAKKGTPYVKVRVEIIEGEHKGTQLTWDGYLSAGALKNTIRGLKAMGFEGHDIATIYSQDMDREFTAQVEHETYNGRTRVRVGRIFGLSPTMSREKLAQLSASLKAAIQAADEPDDAPASAEDGPGVGEDRPRF